MYNAMAEKRMISPVSAILFRLLFVRIKIDQLKCVIYIYIFCEREEIKSEGIWENKKNWLDNNEINFGSDISIMEETNTSENRVSNNQRNRRENQGSHVNINEPRLNADVRDKRGPVSEIVQTQHPGAQTDRRPT